MPAQQWLPQEEVVDAPGVSRNLRLGKPVEVPLEELAFVTEEDLAAVLDPDALNCGNLVDIYQEREADFKTLSRLEVNYLDGAGERTRETLFILEVEMQSSVPKGTPRVCMSMDVCRAMRRAIEVLTRKVDNLSTTLKSCREHYLKELTYLRNCRETNEHNAAWFSPHVYEDNFTKIEIRRRLSVAADQWKDERIEKTKEIQMLRDRLNSSGNDETSHVNRFKLALKIIPFDQVFFCLKQSVEADAAREAAFYGHIERLLAERQEQSGTPSKKGLSDKDFETTQDYIQHIHDLSAQLGDAQARIAELEAEAAREKIQSDAMTPVKPERPPSERNRRLQAHRTTQSSGHDWKAVVASVESENSKLRKDIEEHASQITELQDKLCDSEKELDYKREVLRAKEHDYQHLSQELTNVRRQLQSLKSESKNAVKPPKAKNAGKKGKLNRAQTGGLRPPEEVSWASTSRDSIMSGTSTASDLISAISASDGGDNMTQVSSLVSTCSIAASSKKSRATSKLERATTNRLSDVAKVENKRRGSRRRSPGRKRQDSSSEDNTGKDNNIPSGFSLGTWQPCSQLSVPRRPKQIFVQAATTVMTCLRVLGVLFPRWTAASKKRISDEEQHAWTSKGIEWARSTSSFVMLPENGATFAPSHHVLMRGMGRSVWTSLLAGYIEKLPEPAPSDTVDTKDKKPSPRSSLGSNTSISSRAGSTRVTRINEEDTDFIWTPKGVEWAISKVNLMLLPEIASKVTEAQLGVMQELGGCTPGCLAQVCTNDNSAFVWTTEGIAWARTSRAFPSAPEPGTQVREEELQLVRALGGCPHGSLSLDSTHAQATHRAILKSEACNSYRWTIEGVEWARASQGLPLKDALIDALVTDEEFKSIRAMGGAPSGCITSRGRKSIVSKGSIENMEEWLFEPESVPPTMFEPPEIFDHASSRRNSCPIDLVFGELGELGDVAEEDESREEGIAETRRSSLTKGPRKSGIDVAAQTITTFDLCSASWSCSADLDGGHQQEGVLHGTLRPGAFANGECIESFGEGEEEKSILCSHQSNSIKWSKSLPTDFVVETKIKVLESGFDSVAFGFSSGEQLDQVKIDGNGRAIFLEGSHWGYIDDGRSTPLRSQTWSTLKFERRGGEMTLEIDGIPVLQNIPMNWHIDGLEWQPQQNTMGIAYLKAWPTMGFPQDRMAQEALLQRVQQELLQLCQNYSNKKRRSLEHNREGWRPLSARSFASDGSLGSYSPGAGSNSGVRKLPSQVHHLDDSFGQQRRRKSQPRRCSLEEQKVSEEDRSRFEEDSDEALGRRLSQKSDTKQLRSMIDSRFSSLHGANTSMQTNWSSTRSRTNDPGAWRPKTAQGGMSGRNAATILNSLSHKRQSSAPDDEYVDEQVQMSLGGTYVSRLPR